MEAFEKSGRWWLPETPDRPVAGTIRSNEDGELRLFLVGALGDGGVGDPFDSTDRRIILGVTDEKAGEKPVTLTDTLVTNQSFTSRGTRRQEYFAHRAFWGAHLASPDAFRFQSVKLSLSGLAAWARHFTGFQKGTPDQPFTVIWKQPEAIQGHVLDSTYRLGVGCNLSHKARERVFREEIGLTFTFDAEKTLAQIESELVFPVENLLTLATERPNALMDFQVSGPTTSSEMVKVTGPRTFTDEAFDAELRGPNMLFTLKDVEGRLDDVFRRWLDVSRRYSGALAVYFGKLYDPPGYVDLRFQLLLQAVAVYYVASRSGNAPSLDSALDPLDAGDILRSHPLVMARTAVAGLAGEFAPVIGPIIGGESGEARAAFVGKVLLNLDAILRRGNLPAGEARDGATLYWLGEKVAFLFKIALLVELGFSTTEVTSLLNRNRQFQHIRDHY